jgi:hypothetical protein
MAYQPDMAHDQTQREAFESVARDFEDGASEDRWDATLGKVAKQKSASEELK